ncbi:non-hydrolyzing UDP-N-acetylglucosamine 2-epimerase [Desulfurispira natronophila]|uniref:UDP-GlcNAc3NAcA epimerase n=1 Tax=Desulfurispira natronophila TaxID=682562 RepID=A0A7W8DH66_9BACT|nr:UDP-N-acetylglucosamine 2-epimerase (non-hydrolyzing) [Desulfurispira natronophila]MBB5021963.1 UDP-GlcNAc3NAcA epimerase [Desulfurispira natronophila]
MKILTVVGARPQFIKASAMSLEIAKHDGIKEVIVHTGQHYDSSMSDVFFDEMSIPKPKYNLHVGSGSHATMTGKMMEGLSEVICNEHPDWVLVYGDTNSTLAGALTAKKLHFKVAHMEAGLRSHSMHMPEEVNRIVVDRISDLLLCPTETAYNILSDEGFDRYPCTYENVGDIMLDAAFYYQSMAKRPLELRLFNSDFLLCTIHRAENTDQKNRLETLIAALYSVADHKPIVLPMHPRTQQALLKFNLSFDHPNIFLIEPVGYLQMLWLLTNCDAVLTDSGGLQKEAFFFHKPCLILRSETEWVELLDVGNHQLVNPENTCMIGMLKAMQNAAGQYESALFGDGKCAEKSIELILNWSQN